jgi:hypothetical protein
MLFIGDVHHWCRDEYLRIVRARSPLPSIQVGDLAMGIPGAGDLPVVEGAKFIRGNHDSPEVCRAHPNYLGDFGYWEEHGIFFLSGARSIDRDRRTPGLDWWWDEQLSLPQWDEAFDLYEKVRPRIVVTHECPMSVCQNLFDIYDPDGTKMGLQALLDIHRPENWIFGHHHDGVKKQLDGTNFICLGIVDNENFEQVGMDTVEVE